MIFPPFKSHGKPGLFIHFNPNQMAEIIRNPSEIIVKNPVQSPETWHFLLIQNPKIEVKAVVVVGVPDSAEGEVPVAWVLPGDEAPTAMELEEQGIGGYSYTHTYIYTYI